MKLVHTAVQGKNHLAFDHVVRDFLKMLGVAILGGLFFSLVAGLLVVLVASDAFAHSVPSQKGAPELASTQQAAQIRAAAQQAVSGELVMLDRAGLAVPSIKLETDIYAQTDNAVAQVRLTQTFRNPGAQAVEGWFVLALPEGAQVQRFIAPGSNVDEEEAPCASEGTFMRSLGPLDEQEEISVVVELLLPVLDGALQQILQLPFAKQSAGMLNLLVDLETPQPLVEISSTYAGATIERNTENTNGYVVSAFLVTNKAQPEFELRWTPNAGPILKTAEYSAY